MHPNIHKIIIRDGKYLGEVEAILLLKKKWWTFCWWERKSFVRGGLMLIKLTCDKWLEKYYIDILEDRTTE